MIQINLKSKSCQMGEFISKKGVCSKCMGPEQYSIIPYQEIEHEPRECLQSNAQDVFESFGGFDLRAKFGYQ